MEEEEEVELEIGGCIEELLKYTLESQLHHSLEFPLDLSHDYCSALLQHDDVSLPNLPPHHHGQQELGRGGGGVPSYPLYKHLASALHESITSGRLRSSSNNTIPHPSFSDEDDNTTTNPSGDRKEELEELISRIGSELLDILKSVNFELHVQEPYFSHLKDGVKTVEGRCAVGKCSRIGAGSLILFNKCLVLKVLDVHRYASFSEMLGAENLHDILPGVSSVEEGVHVYRRFYTEEKERTNGVLAVHVLYSLPQPYFCLARLLSGLNYGGIQCLLGLAHTAGTVTESLPPPRSALLSAFQLPYGPNVKSSILTEGARALAKHVGRSSDKYWGSLHGSDSDKNKAALDIIIQLIASSCWLNVHAVSPNGVVFEIRDAAGYGARWSKDGTKFIGFLEPYMKDGHAKGWKH